MKLCIGCGCSEFYPCFEDGVACHWVQHPEGPLCSFCAEMAAQMYSCSDGVLLVDDPEEQQELADDEPLVQMATDAECNAFLRTRGAGV